MARKKKKKEETKDWADEYTNEMYKRITTFFRSLENYLDTHK